MGRTLPSGGPSVKTADPWGGHCQNAGRPICPAPMDLIGTLSSQLGIPADQAQAVAGGVLGALQSKVKGELGDQVAGQLGQAVPELSGWQAKAGQLLGGGGGGGGGDVMSALGGMLGGGGGAGGLAGALGGAVSALTGNGEAAALAGLIGKLGLDPGKAAMVAPMALEFLKSRLNPELLGTVLKVAPFLTGGGGAGGGDLASQASSLLGGLLK